MRVLPLLGLGVALALACGCGSKTGRQPVSGSVSYKGQPLDNATVTFFAASGPPGPLCGALVRRGEFTVPAEQGLEPGSYKVAVSMVVPGGELTPEEKAAGASPKGKESLPEKYNAATTLTAEVKPGQPNRFDFKLD